MARLNLRLLGGFQVRLGRGRRSPCRPRPRRCSHLICGIRPGLAHPRDKLAALLWGDTSDAQARDSLRHAVAGLRKALAAPTTGVLMAEGQTYALDRAGRGHRRGEFERAVAESGRLLREALDRAAALYQGDTARRPGGKRVASRSGLGAGTLARAGGGGAGEAPRPPDPGGRDGGRGPDGDAIARARSAAGAGAPGADAAYAAAGTADRGAQAVPGLCRCAAAGAGDGGRGRDQGGAAARSSAARARAATVTRAFERESREAWAATPRVRAEPQARRR